MSQTYGENPYYPSAGGGGGGYLSGGSPFGSGSGSPGGTGRRGGQSSLRPVTVKQLLNASQPHADAEWTIDDVDVGQITVVAVVVTVQVQTTNCIYWLDDGTGRFEARHWVDSSNEEEAERWGNIEENTYVRVTGSLKSFGNKRYINATHLRPCADPHELYFHILEAAFDQLVYERGPPPRPSEAGQNVSTTSAGGHSAYSGQSNDASAVNDQYSNLPPIQRKIVTFILSQTRNDEGVHVAAIARAVGGDAHSISEALDKLMDEGHVFSTIDDSHFNLSV
ncbi:Replication factor A protein [Sparassis crispa]|uniref:Replication factor A protein n=1 Tax=Sparassis crispa TaxID=139825 RepID=A0A401GJ16_9APHY|nr:Replication factor A protein [Sparassis crispa]GBE82162.1 Replication factor A protein [Sparassis crispa]